MILKVKEAKSFLEKTIGLIGKIDSYPLLIRTRFGIHTFGLAFPIDVVIMDKERKIVKAKQNLLPNRVFFWNPKYDTVLELPAKTIEKKQLKVGNTLNISAY